LHAGKPLQRIFRQGFQDHHFHGWRERWQELAYCWRWRMQMLTPDLERGPRKGKLATKQFVGHYTKCVLIAGWTRLAHYLFWSHIQRRARMVLWGEGGSRVLDNGNAKVTEHDFMAPIEQHILGFDISMNEALLMSILQSLCHLRNIEQYQFEGQSHPTRMHSTQSTPWSIVHDEKRNGLLDAKVEQANNVRVLQMGNCLCFLTKQFQVLACHVYVENFHCRLNVQVKMCS
jgi:hypothetical protein